MFGTLTRAHGVRGEVRLLPSNVDDELPEEVTHLHVRTPKGKELSLEIESMRPAQDVWLVAFVGIHDRDEAQALAGSEVWLSEQELPGLAPGEYYLAELVGAHVVDEKNAVLGEVVNIAKAGDRALLAIRTARGEELLPTEGDALVRFDRAQHTLVVRIPEGLWD